MKSEQEKQHLQEISVSRPYGLICGENRKSLVINRSSQL